MKVITYLYDMDGTEREIDLDESSINRLNDQQLLWVNILERDLETVKGVTTALKLTNVPIKGILRTRERPKIYKFQDFFHFFIVSVEADENGKIHSIPNFEIEYFKSAETGFWLTISAMGFLILGLTTIAKLKNWI